MNDIATKPTSAIKKISIVDSRNTSKLSDDIKTTHTPELVIALCGPIGSPLHHVATSIQNALSDKFGYEKCTIIRLSSFISDYSNKVNQVIPDASGFEKIQAQINVGNKLRQQYGCAVLAELAVHSIRQDRETGMEETGSASYRPMRVCHIIDSVKNQEELDILRMVYREMLFVVGVFSPLEDRQRNLERTGLSSAQVYQLIDRDSGEETETGQTVRDTFPQSDFFLRIESGTDSQLEGGVDRFLNLILGTKVITPSLHESAMYAAATAATNSGCLSRQVGASVTSSDGVVISTGWNDVPRKGGGLYLTEPLDPLGTNDKRCWNRESGKCFNDEEKIQFADQLIETVRKFIPAEHLADAHKAISSCGKLRGLIEFSRSIHAEMHAILNAGNIYNSNIVGGKLFVTTYPCHSCARHIVAAGINEVYYIEPYRKSLAIKLHEDAISEREADTDKVRLLVYDGVAPGRYLDLFKMRPDARKADGKLIKTSYKKAMPRFEKSMEAFPALEGLVVKSLARHQLINVESNNE